jgi:WhiB family transcriptional regulator, redox-sensing transcriptional regulator
MSSMAVTATSGWRDRGACLDEDPELFFPFGSTGPALLQIEEAKAVCAHCPVLAPCRSWALDNPRLAEFGVLGGLSEEERRAARRRRRRAETAARAAA